MCDGRTTLPPAPCCDTRSCLQSSNMSQDSYQSHASSDGGRGSEAFGSPAPSKKERRFSLASVLRYSAFPPASGGSCVHVCPGLGLGLASRVRLVAKQRPRDPGGADLHEKRSVPTHALPCAPHTSRVVLHSPWRCCTLPTRAPAWPRGPVQPEERNQEVPRQKKEQPQLVHADTERVGRRRL